MEDSENAYQTLAATAEGIYTEKGSKFIGIAFPVESETEFKNLLKEIQSRHKGARHYCYAFSIGSGNSILEIHYDV